MKTTHRLLHADARCMEGVPSASVDLVVTSPPYPMIAMWDGHFRGLDAEIGRALDKGAGEAAFELMHCQLDPVWAELYRVLRPGGLACVNIGDATRTLGTRFCLYPNHARLLQRLLELGFAALPSILWRKPTNAPTKFMGSGMLPAGAYVTLEHEFILVVRKGERRPFRSEKERQRRRQSAIFWEERNAWFSDVWTDLRGASQALSTPAARRRSAAFPFELAYRLVCMFSLCGDRVLDPFCGTGTTLQAAMAAGRHSLGFELDPSLPAPLLDNVAALAGLANAHIHARLRRHLDFTVRHREEQKPLRYRNRHYGFAVKTRQEEEVLLRDLLRVQRLEEGLLEVAYARRAQKDFCTPP